MARRARYRTLLPIFRNALAVMIIVMTALVVLAQLGVEIGPLIAGAGVFGVALGFGSQTLVKDVISGVFYMLDDAFRVGEYIQAKNYKGTVEGFSLRSVRLRHHRGPVFTVPFGDLGAVENMSRDWGVVKFRISVSHGADVEMVRKLTKKIGASMLEDPEMGPLFIDPLKMKGIEEFGDYGMALSFGMTLRPSPMQSFIRRRANLLLREAFVANGIDFAMPSVQVDADEKPGAAAAAATTANARAQQLKAAAGAP
jgi:small-conductance mechanosensitive channel